MEIQYPFKGFNSAHEIIEAAMKSGRQVRDILDFGLPEDATKEQLLAAYMAGECSEGYLAARLKVSRVEIRSMVEESMSIRRSPLVDGQEGQ